MAFYNRLSKTTIPTNRGSIEYRSYDRLSVDFLAQSLARSWVYARKAQKRPQLPQITRGMRDQLTRRTLPSEV